MRIAIVGSGMSGLAGAHHLSDGRRHKITVFEAARRFGGRANVPADSEHGPWLFLHDSEHLFALLREVPGSDGSVRDSLRECRRRSAPAWNRSSRSLKRALAISLRPGAALALPGSTERCLVTPWVEFLRARGVVFRASAQVERLAADRYGADLWVNGERERFDLVLVTAFATDAYALLDRSGVPRPLDHRESTDGQLIAVDPARLAEPLRRRVYFGGSWTANTYPVDSAEGACRSAYNAVAAMAADHPRIGPRADRALPSAGFDAGRRAARPKRAHPNAPPNACIAGALWRLAGGLSWLAALPVARRELVDLSGCAWPLDEAGVYVATYRSIFDVPAGVLTLHRLKVFPRLVVARAHFDAAFGTLLRGLGALPALRGTSATITAATAALEAGESVAFTVEGRRTAAYEAERAPHGRGAALTALRANAPIIPIASYGSEQVWPMPRPWPLVHIPRRKIVIVIGEPLYPETSSVDELMDDIRMILLHLEGLARTQAGEAEPTLAVAAR